MSVNPAHRDHDELLIVRAASEDADTVDQRLAAGQLATCEDCRALRADIAAIREATTASTLRVPARPRSFRIPAEDLERLRAPTWRRWLGRLGAPSFDLVRPLATAVAGIGLAVAVLGSASPAAGPFAVTSEPQGTSAPGAPALQAAPGAASTSTPGDREFGGAISQPSAGASAAPASAAGADTNNGSGKGTATGTSAASGQPAAANPAPQNPPARATNQTRSQLPLVPIGAAVLAIGLAMLVLHTAARRTAGR